MKFDWKILWEAVKEPLRLLVLAIIPILLAYFQVIDANWAVGITLLLRFLDKYLHLKEVEGKSGGLVRF